MADDDAGNSFIPFLHKPAALLPIARHKASLLYAIETYPVTILVGQTGSGKSTQLPQYLEQAGWCADGKIIGVTQPRRVAATTIAQRVAEETGTPLGEKVGYSIRFEDVTSASTRIKFMTDGLLLREALVDPLLSRYSVIMVDEAHERSLSTDLLIGLLKKIMKRRPELRIVISSATIQAEAFARFFAGRDAELETVDKTARIVSLEGRAHHVDILYTSAPVEDYVERAVKTVMDIHNHEPSGDILVFMTGRDEIESVIEQVTEQASTLHPKAPSILALPMYAGLSTEQQMYVFEETPPHTRKVIVSTNIAEASVTVEGIAYVIDCGFVKLRAYNPRTGIEILTATPVSKASATQRAGRAGRTKAGKCFRLYTEQAYASLPESTVPEIQRSNLAPMILQLKALGIDNIARFDFFVSPASVLVIRALELLFSLGALDEYAKLTTPLGTRMAELAIEPMMARCLLSASTFNCTSEILSIAAMTTLQGAVFLENSEGKKASQMARRKFAAEEGDHLTLLNVYTAFTKAKRDGKWCHDNGLNFKSLTRAVSVRAQLRRNLERLGVNVDEEKLRKYSTKSDDSEEKSIQIRRCLTSGYFAQAARMAADGSFKLLGSETVVWAHPSSLMFNRRADWVIFNEIIETGDKIFIRDISKVDKAWLLEYAGGYYTVK